LTINVIGDFPWTRPHWVKLKKYWVFSYFSKWETYRCSGRGDILLFLLKRRCKKYF
jgi:hypothetical protein